MELKRLHRQFNGVVSRPSSRFTDESVQPWLRAGFVPLKQRWCPRLENDIHAVCAEAGLSRAAAASVVRAASRGIIAANPGVLLSRLLRFQDCLAEPLGRRCVLSVLRAAPSLLRYSPESLCWNAEMLSSLLPEGSLPGVVSRAPMLLPASAMTLWGNFEGIRTLLRLDHDSALRLVVRAPRLLLNTRGALLGRLQDLVKLSAQPPRRVAALVARQPALLGYFPGTLERNLRHAAALLEVPFARVQKLLTKQPSLAMLSRATLAARVARLRATLDMEAHPEDFASVCLRQPALITLAPDAVAAKVVVVSRVLGLEGQREAVRAVMRGAPQLLTLSTASIEAKAEALRAAVAPCAALAAQLERAPPLSVAVWLCMSGRRYEYVRSVAEAEALAVEAAGLEASAVRDAAASTAAAVAGSSADMPVVCTTDALPGTVGVLLPPLALQSSASPSPLLCQQGGSCGGDGEGGVFELRGQQPEQVMAAAAALPPRRGRGRPRKRPDAGPQGPGSSGGAGLPDGDGRGSSSHRPRLSIYALLREAPGAAEAEAEAEADATGHDEPGLAGSTLAASAATRARRRAFMRQRAESAD
ncbi:hypothetical protein GPECTOR_6g636 [Gonium pectorale]|uniref:Uncharacterized protein n=1 Tax=Gonium pectorale TaxID=33097 RepID=A0A150GV54_GONPE|nr:hypothetical protein GPECTOR_6g636 [Gonium pectorale]|eukprot:KXZ53719.1 hypothetical protein GPECTOR_6g636 [Gonium pectorale]